MNGSGTPSAEEKIRALRGNVRTLEGELRHAQEVITRLRKHRDNLYTENEKVETRLETARRLLSWWEATNPADDHDTRLSVNTREFLAGGLPQVPTLEEMRHE